MDLTKYEKIFAQESGKYLKELDNLLMQVEKNLSNLGLWVEIHGKLHSIKGMARALSLNTISELCHLMEEWCLKFQQGKIMSSLAAVQALFDGSEFLGALISKKFSGTFRNCSRAAAASFVRTFSADDRQN